MMKKLLFLVLMVFVSIGAWAGVKCSSYDGNTKTAVLDYGIDKSSWNYDVDANNILIFKVKGSTNGDNINNDVLNFTQQGWTDRTLDLSEATLTDANYWSSRSIKIAKIIMPNGYSLPTDESVYSQNNGWNGSKQLRYACALSADGKTINIVGGNFENRNNENAIANAITNKVYPFNLESVTKINIVADFGSNYITSVDKAAINEFNAAFATTTFDESTGKLSLAANDLSTPVETIISSLENLNSKDEIITVEFPDGSIFDVSTGKLTSTSSDVSAYTTWLNDNFTLNSFEQTLGNYVSIITEGTNTVVQIQTSGATDGNITSWPGITSDEVSAVESATNVKLVGSFTATTFKAVGDKVSSNIVSLDMSESTGLENTVLGGNIDKTNLQTVILPNTMTDVPAQFAMGCSALTTLSMPNGLKTIGVSAFQNCNNLAYINGGSQGVVSFPTSLEVIGGDAFYGCYAFKEVNLNNLPNLWKVDYAAFNMGNGGEAFSQLTKVNLPSSNNYTLTFFANQVFSSTNVESLDFQYCLGIEHFAYDGANSFNEGTHSGATSNSTETFTYHVKLKHITLPPNLLLVAKDCFSHCPELLTATFKGSADYSDECVLINKLNIDDNAFKDCTKMYEVTLSNNLVRIGKRAFDQTALRSVSIPASVEVIEQMAFNENDDLTTVIFEDIDPNCQCGDDPTKKPSGYATVIKGGSIQYDEDGNATTDPNNQEQGAFWNCKAITDVYINNQTQLQCENLAFVFDVTYGHADANASLATLHFPEKDTDHYANLDHYLTDQIAANSGLFHKWLHEHFRQAIVPKHNGWYEFVNSGPTNNIDNPDDVCQSIILRTFSDWSHSYLVPEGIRAYIVNKIEKNGDNYEVTLRRLLSIPARTGVILYGHPNGKNTKGEPILTMTPISFAKKGQNIMVYDEDGNGTLTEATNDQGLPLSRAYWGNLSTTKTKKKPISDYDMYKNYLEPTCTPTEADYQLLQNRITSLTNKIAKLEEGGITAEEQNDYKDYNAQKTAAVKDLAEIETLWNKHAQDWKKDGEFWGGRYLKPFENEDDDPMNVNTAADVKYRNFGMGRYNSTISSFRAVALEGNEDNYMAFFRLMKGYYPDGKAYLQLENSENEYAEARGAEILVKKDEGDYDEYVVVDDNGEVVIENGQPKKATSPKDSYFVEYSKNDGSKMDMRADGTSNPHGWWVKNKGFDWDIYDEDGSTYDGPRKNWGKRPTRFGASPELAPVYLGEFEEDTDGIVKLVIPAEQEKVDGHFYNLQGVKVNNPVKGIYIHNGKKVTIK